MPNAPAFEFLAAELERQTSFDRLAARGTVRLALRQAGLDPHSVTADEMEDVVARFLERELECRGVTDPGGVCRRLRAALQDAPRESQKGTPDSLFSSESLGKPR